MISPRMILRSASLAAVYVVAAGLIGDAISAQSSVPATDTAKTCQYDRAQMLALDYQSFDQTLNRGWRIVADRPGCDLRAADLVRDYRLSNKNLHPMLLWHEGQLRASGGSVSEAVPLMEQARPLSASIPGWNELVDATIAFLRKDRIAFDKAKTAIDAVPQARFAAAVDKLAHCFGMPYTQALACEK
jgi:hypothetical protein